MNKNYHLTDRLLDNEICNYYFYRMALPTSKRRVDYIEHSLLFSLN